MLLEHSGKVLANDGDLIFEGDHTRLDLLDGDLGYFDVLFSFELRQRSSVFLENDSGDDERGGFICDLRNEDKNRH